MTLFTDILTSVFGSIAKKDSYKIFDGMSLPDFIFKVMRLYHPGVPAAEFEGRQISRSEYIKTVKAISKGLYAIGVRDNDCVLSVVEDEIPEEGPLILALMLLGAYAYNLRPEAEVSTIKEEKNRDPASANCNIGFFSQSVLEEKGEGLHDLFDKIIVIGWGDEKKPESNDKTTFYSVKDLIELGKSVSVPKVKYGLSKTAIVVSTSGSTAKKGDNKGVVLSTGNIIAAICQGIAFVIGNNPAVAPGGKIIARGPYSIIAMFFITYIVPLLSGLTIIYDRELSSTNIGLKLQEHKANGTFASGPEWECIDYQIISGELTDLSNFTLGYWGGAGSSPKVMQSLNEGIKKCGGKSQVMIGYGASEIASSVSSQTPDYPISTSKRQLVSNGFVFPGARIIIRDENGNEITEKNRRGTVCIKSFALMKGYYGRPEQTAKVLNEHGEYVTYDIGYFNDNNELFIYGRGKDVVTDKSGTEVYIFDIADEIYCQFNDYLKRVHIFGSEEGIIICLSPDQQIEPDDELGQKICGFAAEKFNLNIKGYSFWPFFPISRARKLDKELMHSKMIPFKG